MVERVVATAKMRSNGRAQHLVVVVAPHAADGDACARRASALCLEGTGPGLNVMPCGELEMRGSKVLRCRVLQILAGQSYCTSIQCANSKSVAATG